MNKKGIGKTPIMERIAGKYTVNKTTGCWQWNRSLSGQGKYPTIAGTNSKRPEYVHKVVWESANGEMPTNSCPDGSDRWELHHRCFDKSCINHAHIALLTRKQHAFEHKLRSDAIRASKTSRVIPFPANPVNGSVHAAA